MGLNLKEGGEFGLCKCGLLGPFYVTNAAFLTQARKAEFSMLAWATRADDL